MNFVKRIMKYIVMLFGFVVIAGVGKLISAALNDRMNMPASQADNVQEVIFETASAMNLKTPIMVDADTRLDSVAPMTKGLVYHFTMVSANKSELNMNFVNTEFSASVKNKACMIPELAIFFDNGVSVSYVYNDKSGIRINVIEVTNEYCTSIRS